MKSILTKSQFTTKEKTFTEEGKEYRIKVKVRYDDECGNGHNSFSITGQIDRKTQHGWYVDECGGCIHDEIVKHFPELKKYIKWHLVSSDEPIHYIANTIYLAGDKDYNGLRKGEKRQITNGRTGKLCWVLKDSTLERYIDSDQYPTGQETLNYEPLCHEGKGKEPDLEGARCTAIWPDATLEQLTNKELLLARLPALMEEFKKDVEELGFIY